MDEPVELGADGPLLAGIAPRPGGGEGQAVAGAVDDEHPQPPRPELVRRRQADHQGCAAAFERRTRPLRQPGRELAGDGDLDPVRAVAEPGQEGLGRGLQRPGHDGRR